LTDRPKTIRRDPASLAEAVRRGERAALARAITLVESTRADDRRDAEALLDQLLPNAGGSIRLGISGAPGVGKSTFIDAFGMALLGEARRVAVLAVDPSSRRTGGSILGDKTRMAALAREADAFIRPSPAGGSLGGVARRTRDAMLVAEAAGFDVVIVETVGVGQSETMVAEMVDLFLLLIAPGGGDELQGIKKGIVETADLVIVTKDDGDLAPAARRAVADYRHALRMLAPSAGADAVEVLAVSALRGKGIERVWRSVIRRLEAARASGEFLARRRRQAVATMWREIADGLLDSFRANSDAARLLPDLERRVAAGSLTPLTAARLALAAFHGATR
jgi:GTPase